MSEVEEQKKFRVYKHVSESAQYVFGDAGISGQCAVFIKGVYYTDDTRKIAELDRVCSEFQIQLNEGRGTRFIFVDPEFKEATQDELDPKEAERRAIRNRARAELLKELEEAGRLVRDGGSYATPQNIIAPKTLAGNVAQSNSGVKVTPVVPFRVPAAHEIDKA
jgi:hypothetical protein